MKYFLLISLLLCLAVSAQDVASPEASPVPLPAQETSAPTKGLAVQQSILKEVVEQNQGLDGNELLAFCNDACPDLLDEWKRLCQEQPDKAKTYLELLTKRYLKAIALRNRDTAEYDRYVKQLKNETQIRTLSRRIQLLEIDDDNTQDERKQLKLQLAALMEKAFDDAQLQQQIEINRLENEVRNLRSLAEERAANKQFILRQRFLLLTGEEWPSKE
ncbi:MAG: hypothetical protein IKR81_14225 [Victivallales bacterium]|nr:hypothetical protein [Victivallales bacterium]